MWNWIQGVVSSALVASAAGIGVIASYLNKRARDSRRELRRAREGLEYYARWAHRSRMYAEENGFTLPPYPIKLRRLLRIEDEGDEEEYDEA